MERQFLTISQASEALGIGKSKMYDLISAGIIPTVTLKGTSLRRVPVAGLQDYIDQQVPDTKNDKAEAA